ncbi:hypothetical protein JTB14_034174 [Gonioctena quinquepunctata]|nr:hypothetical protein JTB14_034174 [Gonioctena quinquepunctata]
MKVKDIERTANVAWSPKNQYPIYLAAGTAAQQLDASFNTSAALEIYSLNLSDPGPDTQLVSSIPSDHRFHKIIWGAAGNDQASGTIVGGCDSGLIQIYSASKLLKSEDAIIGKQELHTGPVQAMDFNNFQQNLFATGAGDSEIFIWDLNNTSTPMSPGTKSQPHEDVLSISWNKQVQHILASTFPSKYSFEDSMESCRLASRCCYTTLLSLRRGPVPRNPVVGPQIRNVSVENSPRPPERRPVLSWCSEDPDLLVSCGKDNRILCWNPNSNQQNGEVLAEVARTNQWSFDIVWCPRNPALIASPNFDGHVPIYSLMGGKTQQIQTTNKIADSFPGMEGYAQAPVPQQNIAPISFDLSKPPRWLKRPVRASFGFGGKLITFENDKEAITQALQNVQPGQAPAIIHRTVQISQVITEAELVKKSSELEKTLEYGNFTEYCQEKSEEADDQHKKYIWHFLKANFEESPRAELLNLLGYSIEDVNEKLDRFIPKDMQNNIDGLTNDFDNMNRIEDFTSSDPFSSIARREEKKAETFKIKTDDDTEGLITQALLMNNVAAAVELCLTAKRFADALIIATTGGPDLMARTQLRYLEQCDDYVSSLISAIVSEDWSSIIKNCEVGSWKEALSAVLTHASDDDLPVLCEQLGNRLEEESKSDSKLSQDAQLCYICAGSFERLVSSWSDNAMKSTDSLQELIELVTFLQKAIERQGRQVQVSGALADLLSHYASLLASQGNLSTALNYLGSSTNEKVASLRDRLNTALGHKPSNQQEMRQQQRRSSQRQSFTNYSTTNTFANTNPFNTSQQSQFGQAPPPPVSQYGQNQFNTGLPSASATSQPWQTQAVAPAGGYAQPPQTFSPAPQGPPPSHPPRPVSVGSTHGGSTGLPSRKYLLDPSVSSSPYGLPPTQYPSQPVNSYQNSTFSNNSYAPPSNVNPLVPTTQNVHNLNPLVPSNSSFPTASGDPNPIPMVPSQGYGGSALPPPPHTAEVAHPALNAFMAPCGWNDPPPVSRHPKAQPKSDMSQNQPITHPMYGTAPAQPSPTNGFNDMNPPPPTQPYNPSAYPQNPPTMYQPQAMQNNSGQSFNPGNFNQNAVSSVAQQLKNVQGTVQPEKPRPVEKAPIPEEHIHMKTVLDELRNQCSCSASNPQMKRKLEDVSRKLESLYDLLREYKLSPSSLSSLHQMVQCIQNGDYAGGLNIHTQLVSGSDFAQIANFMPGLKVLLQCASQLQVYLR